MNTDKIYAEQLANEYALKDTSKVIARAGCKSQKLPQPFLPIPSALSLRW